MNQLSSRQDIVSALRAFSELGYIGAFGHVSLRAEKGILISATSPAPFRQAPEDILLVSDDGEVIEGDASKCPLEVYLHTAIFAARRDVSAICRTHSPNASIWTVMRQEIPPILHGFGGFVGSIGQFDCSDLVYDAEHGRAAATSLGTADALFLKGNGVLTAGSNIAEAAARAWALEERCLYASKNIGSFEPFCDTELEARSRWFKIEMDRCWSWLQAIASH